MSLRRQSYEEFAIIPVAGRAIFTITGSRPLTLPKKISTSSPLSRLVVIGLLSLSLWSRPTVTKAAVTPDDLYQATNTARAQAQLAPLSHDARLDASAKLKADDMFAQQYFAHES